MLVAGATADFSVLTNQKARLQAAADAGSLAAAKELGLSDSKTENVQAIVEAVVKSYLGDNHDSAYGGGALTVTTLVRDNPLGVDVTATQSVPLPFGAGVGLSVNEITARSVARIAGRPNICVLGLDAGEAGTISLETSARVTGKDCAVFSNSAHSNGLKAKNSATLVASLICSRGGKEGSPENFSPDPIVDCPGFEDPLAARPEPQAGPCLETDLVIKSATRALSPGTYCGGIFITKGSAVSLDPGIYVIKDGPLIVNGGSSLSGTDVGFYFTGPKAVFDFDAKSSISLAAPKNGAMAGILMFESRSQEKTGTHMISSDDARMLLGTIYLPQSEVRVDASSPVADESAYTAIVARALRLYGGPHLVLNTNYDATDVPAPEGIKGAGQPVALTE